MANYIPIARKWRPHSFTALVGQSHVVQTLKNTIELNRVGHAYLFCGARGIGKTTVARIFAKALRCPNTKLGEPCNECTECQQISDGRAVDVMEIDGASNNGVEAIRTLRENVSYGAASGFYKIYIIDEVHMLSLSAFNALLKTLEEPPSHVVFIFATTETQKIPLTILSRCQRFEFRRFSSDQMVKRLQEIIAAEKVTLSEGGLRIIARHADGSLRDALSLLDQALSYYAHEKGKELGEAEITQALGVNSSSLPLEYLSHIIGENQDKLLHLIEETYLAGVDLKYLLQGAVEELRNLYLIKISKQASAESLDIAAQHFEQLTAMAQKVETIQIERMAQILTKTLSQLNYNPFPQFLLEMASIRMMKLKGLSEGETTQTIEVEEVAAPVKVAAPVQAPEKPWELFVGEVSKKRPLLGAILQHAQFKLEGKQISLTFPKGSFYEKQALDTRNRSEIEAHLKQRFGQTMMVTIQSSQGDKIESLETAKLTEQDLLRKKVLEHPLTERVKSALNADLIDIKVGD